MPQTTPPFKNLLRKLKESSSSTLLTIGAFTTSLSTIPMSTVSTWVTIELSDGV